MPTAPFTLTGRTALVTGSSRGIGNALAAGLAEAGATVVVHGLDPERLEAARLALAERFGKERIAAVSFDITDADGRYRLDEVLSGESTVSFRVWDYGVTRTAVVTSGTAATLDAELEGDRVELETLTASRAKQCECTSILDWWQSSPQPVPVRPGR